MAQYNVKKAKVIHEQRQIKRDEQLFKMKHGTVATTLEEMINTGYKQPKRKR